MRPTKTFCRFQILMGFIAVIASGCSIGSTDSIMSDKVAQSEVWQSYSVSYQEVDAKLISDATFRVGGVTGTTMDLTSNSSVTSNIGAMNRFTGRSTGTYYKGERRETLNPSQFPQTYSWTYRNNDGKIYRNSITMESIGLPDFKAGEQVSRSKDVKIRWNGKPLQADESVTVIISWFDSVTKPNSTVIEVNNTVGTDSVVIATTRLTPLDTGMYKVQFKRTKTLSVQEGTGKGGLMRAEYTGAFVKIELIN